MAITIKLRPELEGLLRDEAARHGMDVGTFTQAIIEERLGGGLPETEEVPPGDTLDRVLAGHIGLIDVAPSELSDKTGDPFMDGLIEKYRKQGLTI